MYVLDINECDLPSTSCPSNEICQNIDGSYKCVCKDGYGREGGSCVKGEVTLNTRCLTFRACTVFRQFEMFNAQMDVNGPTLF